MCDGECEVIYELSLLKSGYDNQQGISWMISEKK